MAEGNPSNAQERPEIFAGSKGGCGATLGAVQLAACLVKALHPGHWLYEQGARVNGLWRTCSHGPIALPEGKCSLPSTLGDFDNVAGGGEELTAFLAAVRRALCTNRGETFSF
jgi:hypothetical protein